MLIYKQSSQEKGFYIYRYICLCVCLWMDVWIYIYINIKVELEDDERRWVRNEIQGVRDREEREKIK